VSSDASKPARWPDLPARRAHRPGGIALAQAVSKGGDLNEPSVKAVVAALDANSVAISKAVGSAYPDVEALFLDSLRQHIGFFVNYPLGKATNNAAMVAKARKDLNGYRTSFGQLINSVVPELPAACGDQGAEAAREQRVRHHRLAGRG
jgi:hypothetical protein